VKQKGIYRGLKVAGWCSLGVVAFLCLLHWVPDVDDDGQKAIFAVLLTVGLFLASVWQRTAKSFRRLFLAGLCLLALANMFRWSTERLSRVDYHDVTCYYLGGKYADELGPYELYPATVLADSENRRWANLRKNYWAQSREGFERERLHHALKRGKQVRKQHFTSERWEEFEQDVLALQDEMGKRRFQGFLVDKGFNATPAWIAYAHPLIELVPVEYVEFLTILDALLLTIAFAFVAHTFGGVVGLWGLFFFCSTISTKWLVPGSVILRYDWLSAILIAMCFVKRSSQAVAGGLVAVAALLRVFPAVWMFGAIPRAVYVLGSVPRKDWWSHLRGPMLMFGAFSIVFTLGEFAAVSAVGVESAKDHAVKMMDHTSPEMISSKRPGLALATTYDGDLARELSTRDRKRMHDARPLNFALAGLLLLAFAWVLRKKTEVEMFAFGYVPFFLLATGTYYYHVARITLVLNHAIHLDGSHAEGLRHRMSLSFLLVLEIFSQIMLAHFASYELFWTSVLSLGLLAYCVGNLLGMAREGANPAPSSRQLVTT
jgi:hypothetical protein